MGAFASGTHDSHTLPSSGKSLSREELWELRAILARGWSGRTCYRPSYYKYMGCASWGQCYVTARAVQEVFGWHLVINKRDGNNHYWNVMPNGVEVDFTSDQMRGNGIDPPISGRVSKWQIKPIAESGNRRLKFYFLLVEDDLRAFAKAHGIDDT